MVVNSNAGLTPYNGSWTINEALHLLRRTTVGARYNDAALLASYTMNQAIDSLFNVSNLPAPPLNNYSSADPNVPLGTTWVSAPFDGNFSGNRMNSFKSWVVGNILNSPVSIEEKLTIFFHNHFSTESDVVGDPRMVYLNYKLLRENCLGNFKTLVKKITVDLAMLKYLNGFKNTKNAPDENYARELQELFTIGKDTPNTYTEGDVKAAAKVLTGYRIDTTNYSYTFDSTKHDTTSKQFSAYYNNTVIVGQTGSAGVNELDDLLNMIFSKNEVSEYICRKLYRYFVYYEIDASIESNIIQPMAIAFRNANYDITVPLKLLLKSAHFFDFTAKGAIIKQPLDVIFGLLKEFNVQFPAASNFDALYKHWWYYFNFSKSLIQEYFNPPSVSGWEAYYIKPNFHEAWITSTTISTRLLFMEKIINTGYTASSLKTIVDVLGYTTGIPNAGDPDLLINQIEARHFAISIDSNRKAELKNILLSNQTSNYYWTNAWNDYVTNPTNNTYRQIVETRLKSFYKVFLNYLEYQLI